MEFITKHRRFFFVLFLCLFGYFSLVGFWTGLHAKLKLSNYVRNRSGLDLEMGLVYIYPFTGNGFIKNIRIPNPSGYLSQDALSINEIRFHGNYKTFYSDVIQFSSMEIKGIEIHYEPHGESNNFQQIYYQARKSYHGNNSTWDEGFKTVQMNQLNIDVINVFLGPKILNKTLTLEPVVFNDVGMQEQGVGLRHFGEMLQQKYTPIVELAVQNLSSDPNDSSKQNLLRWLLTPPGHL